MRKLSEVLASGDGNVDEIVTTGETPLTLNDMTWIDLVGDIAGAKLDSAAGKIDFDFNEGMLKFQDSADVNNNNDSLQLSFQVNHNIYRGAGAVAKPHLHIIQTSTITPKWKVEYKILNTGVIKPVWSVLVADGGVEAMPYTSGDLDQVIILPDIDISGVGLSARILLRVWHSGTVSGSVLVSAIDCHVPVYKLGSKEPLVQ